MPILRNDRYNSFEYGAPRDELRGIPLTKFPWTLENETVSLFADTLNWDLQVICTNAFPSGFGTKLCFELTASARLSPSSIQKHGFGRADSERVRHLFSLERFELTESESVQREGELDNLPKIAAELKKSFILKLKETWPPLKAEKHLRSQYQFRTPGGFGDSQH
ncbi:MAG: hypothetical protein RJB13_253 [Pseudomonadota bacterium]